MAGQWQAEEQGGCGRGAGDVPGNAVEAIQRGELRQAGAEGVSTRLNKIPWYPISSETSLLLSTAIGTDTLERV